MFSHVLVRVWIHGENGKITMILHDFDRSYTLKLQQNHGVTNILPNWLIQTYTYVPYEELKLRPNFTLLRNWS
jgi:hypothetical protein